MGLIASQVGNVVQSSVDASGRSEAGGLLERKTGARAVAVDKLIGNTAFVGSLANNWEERPWSGRGYFSPDPGSPGQSLNVPAPAGAPKLPRPVAGGCAGACCATTMPVASVPMVIPGEP